MNRRQWCRALLCWVWLSVVLGETQSEEETQVEGYDSSSYWPLLAAAAVHTWYSLDALLELVAAPTPVPLRLPHTVKPLQYAVEFLPEYQERVVSVHETILLKVTEVTANITLHAKDLCIDEAKLSLTEQSSGEKVTVISLEEEEQNTWVILHLASELQPDKLYTLDLYVRSPITDSMAGIQVHNYSESDNRWILVSHFEPIGARYSFPCFDEPSFKAQFNISIATPPGYHALSNMPLTEASEPVADHPDWVWSRFQQSPPMSTYLVGFVVSDLVSVRGERNFTVWVQPGKEMQASLMIKLGPPMLAALEELTAIPFTLPKQDNVAIPSLANMPGIQGTENWGIITYTDTNIIFDEKQASNSKKRTMCHILAHELAHNWFGNLVTPQFWDELWLKEGFARYLQYYISSKVLPNWEMEKDFQISTVQNSMDYMDSTILHSDADIRRELYSKYNVKNYDAGAAMVYMMEHILTTDTFLSGIRTYLKTYAYQSASTKEFFHVMDAAAANTSSHGLPPGVGLGEVMKPWLFQARYPLITVSRNYTTGQVTVCQEEIKQQGEQKWWVPLSYTVQAEGDFNNTTPRLWLSPNESCVSVAGLAEPHEWIIFNIRQTGYYRVNYDEENWQLLADFLNSDNYSEIHIMNRAQLLDDMVYLAVARNLSQEVFQNVISYLKKETNPIPWLVVLWNYSFRETAKESFRKELLQSFYKLIEGLPSNTTLRNPPQLWEKAILYSCDDRLIPQCFEDAYRNFKIFQLNPSNYSFHPGLKDDMFCNVLQSDQTTREDLMFVWEMAKNSTHRRSLLAAMQWCPTKRHLVQGLMIAVASDGDWMTSTEREELIWIVCARQENVKSLEVTLNILEDQYSSLMLSADLHMLQSITTVIQKLPIIDRTFISQMWCQISLGWLTGTRVSFPI